MSKSSGSNMLLPTIVLSLMLDHEAFLVGSAVPWFHNGSKGERPKDLDLIIAPENWTKIVRMIPNPTLSKFGGIKFEAEGWVIDIWPSSLSAYFRLGGHKVPRYALSMNPYIIIERTN